MIRVSLTFYLFIDTTKNIFFLENSLLCSKKYHLWYSNYYYKKHNRIWKNDMIPDTPGNYCFNLINVKNYITCSLFGKCRSSL